MKLKSTNKLLTIHALQRTMLSSLTWYASVNLAQ